MARARGGRIVAGLLLGSAGAALLWAGIAQPDWAGDLIRTYPTRNVAVGGGVGLVGGGILLILLSFTSRKESASVVPAEVAFSRQPTPRPMAIPEARPTASPSPRASPSMPLAASSVAAALPSAPPVSESPEQIALKRITAEIRELTRAINKAGVMLATGQISSQGYAQYVEELKQQRGVLERDRVQLEMRNHKLN